MENYIAQRYVAAEDAEVSGANVSVLLGTLRDNRMKPFLEEQGFDEVDANAWYPQQEFLDLIKKIEETLTYEELVAVGMKGAQVLQVPPEIKNFRQVLPFIVEGYGLHHRNVPQAEGYQLEEVDDSVTIECNIPYPPFVLFGYIYGLIKKFEATDPKHYHMKIDEAENPYNII
ncbi:MAG: hypothetical protein AAF653_19995, partial [Chloroflexota bacterium]